MIKSFKNRHVEAKNKLAGIIKSNFLDDIFSYCNFEGET